MDLGTLYAQKVTSKKKKPSSSDKIAFIITHFDALKTRVPDMVKHGLTDAGFRPVTFDQLIATDLIGETMFDIIQRADLIVADVSRHNPNVMYELGFAHALRKPTIMIISRQAAAKLPADLAGYLYISYDESNLESLRNDVASIASRTVGRTTG